MKVQMVYITVRYDTFYLLYPSFLSLFNNIWKTGNFTPHWREDMVLPFLKPSKTGTLPQALTSYLCKLMERMINFRLKWYLGYLKSFHQVHSDSVAVEAQLIPWPM